MEVGMGVVVREWARGRVQVRGWMWFMVNGDGEAASRRG